MKYFLKLKIVTLLYLGILLNDLTMMDAATSDLLPDGLIHVDKKKKRVKH